MIEEAYDALYQLEEHHWWYVGARAAYRSLLELGLGRPTGRLRMLDVGVGTGGNLELLSDYGSTTGLDFSLNALRKIGSRPATGIIQGSADHLPFVDNAFDGVTLLGLIEHVEDDLKTLKEAARVCKPEGAVVLLTSAVPALWSHHDEANQHLRRYTRSGLQALVHEAGLRILRLSYLNFSVFFPVLFVRVLQRLSKPEPHYDMGRPREWTNLLLKSVMCAEARILRHVPLPIGVNLVAACRPVRPS
ncbi:MAG: class I SAM-dependent methyltransferase [Planctomycetota bacterium]|nr:class I SAM-dependent methyltransferase [Planctomycetota bacterium]MDA1137923.1 class I SAM-dependent methyltransferase [Planctomycetota bacterium]